MNYQWYPGHMTKAVRMMQENIKLIDLIIELVDARIPLSSRNPDINELGRNKFRIVLLNKSDLADPAQNRQWLQYFEEQGAYALEVNARSGAGINTGKGHGFQGQGFQGQGFQGQGFQGQAGKAQNVLTLVQEACKEKIERDKKRGIVNRPVRAMVVGIPNVGKSTFINAFAGKACAKTGNKPGVTKGKQWIRLNKSLELLDTPGILWPKFEDQEVGMRLAFIGSMNDEIIIQEELACDLIREICRYYPEAIPRRYGIVTVHESATGVGQDLCKEEAMLEEERDSSSELTAGQAAEILREIAVSRRCFAKGEEPDLNRAALLFIDDFRSGRLGRMTLERRPS